MFDDGGLVATNIIENAIYTLYNGSIKTNCTHINNVKLRHPNNIIRYKYILLGT